MATIVIPLPVLRVPSQRDQQIFAQVEGLGRLQTEVAAEFGLTQSRVSQICKRVGVWRARARPRETGELSRREQAQLDMYLDRLRLEEIYKQSMREFHKSSQPLVTVRERVKGGEVEFIETTTRGRAANVQFLKAAMKAQEQLGKLSQRELPVDRAEDSGKDVEWFKLQDYLKWARVRVENEGRVKPCGDPDALASHALGIVFGEDVQFEPRTEVVRIRKRPPGAKPTRHELEREEWEREAARKAGGQGAGDRGQGTGDRGPSNSSSTSSSTSEQIGPHSNAGVAGAERSSAPVGDAGGQHISETQPGAHKVNTPQCDFDGVPTPEERIRLLEEACGAGTYLTAADRAVLQRELEAERKNLANISAEGLGAGDWGLEAAQEVGGRQDSVLRTQYSVHSPSSLNAERSPSSSPSPSVRTTGRKVYESLTRPTNGTYTLSYCDNYAPPLDLGHRPSVPSKEWLEDERERRREYLKSLVPVVTETGGD